VYVMMSVNGSFLQPGRFRHLCFYREVSELFRDGNLLEGSDKLARDAFVHSVKVFTSLVLFYTSIISHNSGAPTEMSVSGSTISYNRTDGMAGRYC